MIPGTAENDEGPCINFLVKKEQDALPNLTRENTVVILVCLQVRGCCIRSYRDGSMSHCSLLYA